MTSLVTCDTYNTGMATKQDKLLNCAGAALPGGTKVPSCDEVDDAIAAAVPLATTSVAGLIEEATDEETRLGATDANRADRAVTPASMSSTLQTNKEYALAITSTDKNTGAFTSNVTNGTSDISAVRGNLTGTGAPTSNSTLAAVYGVNQVVGTGQKTGVNGKAVGSGGTNYGVYGYAANGTINWAGYFEGNTNTTGIVYGQGATNEETRLGVVSNTFIAPDDLSYTLQTGKDYPIHVKTNGAGNTGVPGSGLYFLLDSSTAINPVAIRGTTQNVGTTALYASGGAFQLANIADLRSDTEYSSGGGFCAVTQTVTVNTGHFVSGVVGYNTALGTGTKYGTNGRSEGFGGVNIGVFGNAVNGTTNWAGYFNGNVTAGPITTLSDATLKENVAAIDPAKALQFRNGLRWVSYEMFTEQQEQITETVTDGEGNETQVPTGRYEVKRNSLGHKYGLIAQEIQALAEKVGAFADVVSVVGEYFTLDAQGYPVKGADGEPVVNKRYGLDYDAINVIVMAAEQTDSSVSRRQAFRALHQFGLLETVEAAVAQADKITQIEWETAQAFNRNYGTVIELAKGLGLTDKQLDDLFALARTL